MSKELHKLETLEAEELSLFQRLTSDEQFHDNHLLPEINSLHQLYRTLAKYTGALIKDRDYLTTQLANMNRSLDLATRVDPMTGLANRRAIMEMIEQEFSRSHRHQRSTSIIMADLDNFKKVNEMHGFNIGDDVLVEVARVLRGCLRQEDVCARWGGEEFLMLLPETPLHGALAAANKIRESVAMTEFKVNHPGVHLTISLGVCEYQADQNILEAISKADQAMFQAKLGGRNRTVVAG